MCGFFAALGRLFVGHRKDSLGVVLAVLPPNPANDTAEVELSWRMVRSLMSTFMTLCSEDAGSTEVWH